MTKLGNVIKNLKSIYPSGSARDINAFLDILHEVTSLNVFLNRYSSIPVFQSIKVHLQVSLAQDLNLIILKKSLWFASDLK